jgi:hypothetical protein
MPAVPLRVLVIGLPSLLHDLVASAFDERGDLVMAAAGGELGQKVAELQPDVLIVALSTSGLSSEANAMLEQQRRPLVVAIDVVDGRSTLHELRPRRIDLGEVAPHELPDILRSSLTGRAIEH